ncbi:hypothetical protein ACMFMF_004993 [Clarireedia jacksonii]
MSSTGGNGNNKCDRDLAIESGDDYLAKTEQGNSSELMKELTRKVESSMSTLQGVLESLEKLRITHEERNEAAYAMLELSRGRNLKRGHQGSPQEIRDSSGAAQKIAGSNRAQTLQSEQNDIADMSRQEQEKIIQLRQVGNTIADKLRAKIEHAQQHHTAHDPISQEIKLQKEVSVAPTHELRPFDGDSTVDYSLVEYGSQKYRIQVYDHQNRKWTATNVPRELFDAIKDDPMDVDESQLSLPNSDDKPAPAQDTDKLGEVGELLDRRIERVLTKIWATQYLMWHQCTPEFAKQMLPDGFADPGWDSKYWESKAKTMTEKYTTKVFQIASQINALADAQKEFNITIKRASGEHYRPRAEHYLTIAGHEIFNQFEDVIVIQDIVSKESVDKDAIEYGIDFLAHACYIAAKERTDQNRSILWGECQNAKFGKHDLMKWPMKQMKLKDIPELARVKMARKLLRESSPAFTGQDRKKKDTKRIRKSLHEEEYSSGK